MWLFFLSIALLVILAAFWQLRRLKLTSITLLKESARPASEKQNDAAPIQPTLLEGLSKTRLNFRQRLALLVGRKQFDGQFIEQLEELLFTADIGAKTSELLLARVKERLSKTEILDENLVIQTLKEESRKLLSIATPTLNFSTHKPYVILVIGVNGAGKTTTIGKLAAQFQKQGQKVALAAGDTFRAAAAKQLEVWAQRTNATIFMGNPGADPSAVIFDGIKQATQLQADVLLADTAGRLHVKTELMEELRKVRRVMAKADATAPHQTWLVLDATNGQNAIAQATVFNEALAITGIILTKLDGTAKGGVILGIVHELQVPVVYVGIGERVEDLQPFSPDEFIEALYAPV